MTISVAVDSECCVRCTDPVVTRELHQTHAMAVTPVIFVEKEGTIRESYLTLKCVCTLNVF